MRIGISCYPTIGGSGAVATELGKALAHRGHEVHFIVTDVPFRLGGFHPNIYVHELDTTTYPVLRTPPYDLSLAALMAKTVERYDLDILHVHYALPFAVCAFLAKEMVNDHRVKVVTTLHGTDITVLAQEDTLVDVIRLGITKSDAVTAVSQSLSRQTHELFHVEKQIECIYNFVDPDVFRPKAVQEVKRCLAKPGEKVLLHTSNFRKVKRVPDVIRIFANVQAVVPSRLALVGEGPELNEARNLVRQLGLTEKVEFLGKQDEVAELFAAADLFLLPSEKESFGLVALEAMAAGVPVVGTVAGGIPEVVLHGKTGFLAEVGDITSMSEYAIRLLTDDGLYQSFSEAGRMRAENEFSLDVQVAEYERLYQRLVESEAVAL
ncbi:N-acetyl-alpha-D-glucosaminyl L-malate synthase BshA [Alicyclobacillus ferrooxydans]|uniref:N-acetyl-alpha-D-glucosaminyl L-malate synthase n=1 Tax=Alicyclobacillus ferrooxydans TaxID=471514 RepID=A0A0P9D625_9BACL|nr:N-acetyl-alpha-D-glucosaminyl L-malate synthase BshA [Alicyclobacillus ferrooxydans]KPV44857.1 N-acetyl-alpha-D-glucosaminyl L-malate synthase [Alicyclobacillus ferrooxydans]